MRGGLHTAGAATQFADQVLFTIHMTSRARSGRSASATCSWPRPWWCLFIELLKSTTSRKVAIINHSLSMILFIVCLVEFLLFPAFATSIFFLITLMVLLDVLAGFIVTIVVARATSTSVTECRRSQNQARR